MPRATTAADLGVPETFNVATHFVDRHLREGRAGHVAIECGDERVTYAQLADGVNRFGSSLRETLDVRPEDRVVLLVLDGPAFAYAFFGAIKIGAVPIPTNTLWRPADYRYVLRDSRARVLVVSEALLPQVAEIASAELPALRHIIVADHAEHHAADRVTLSDLLAAGSATLDPEPTSRDAPAFWLYSSGSTGAPKACVHLHHDMVICAELFAKGVLGIGPADRCFSVAKLFFAYGLGNGLYFPLAVGATSVLWPGAPTPANVYAVIERHRPTLLFSVPTGYAMLLAHPEGRPDDLHHARRRGGASASPEAASAALHDGRGADCDLASVRLAVSAGEALPPALYERFKRRFGVDIIDGIGSTEVLHMFISNRPGVIRPGSSGLVVPGYEANILDEEKQAVARGEIGDLWVSGDSICAYYWNQHEKTKATLEGDWIRTGDKYTQDEEGFYWYAGRADDMLKVGGLWVSPIEVENALVGHPAVQECGVVGREDQDALVKPMAFVVLRSGHDATPPLAVELQQFVRSRLADYKRPRWVAFVEELPKTATGKIQRYRLRELANKAEPRSA